MYRPGFLGGRNVRWLIISLEMLFLVFLGYYACGRLLRPDEPQQPVVDLLASCTAVLLAVLLVRGILRAMAAETEVKLLRTRLQESRRIIDLLRTQRHDFLNHLQVIYGLIQVGRTGVIREYIDQINQEMHLYSRLLATLMQRPEIAGLILRKQSEAERAGISFEVEVKTDLALLGVPPLDLARILGNLITNALDAVGTVPAEERRLRLEMSEDDRSYEIRVTNYRPLIPEAYQERVFRQGFTTKTGRGEGLGLYIVKTLVDKHHGEIGLKCSEATGTTFTLRFPKLTGENWREI